MSRKEKLVRKVKRELNLEMNELRRKQRRVKQLALSTLRNLTTFRPTDKKRCNTWKLIKALVISQEPI